MRKNETTYWDYDERLGMAVQKTMALHRRKILKKFKIMFADGRRTVLRFGSKKEAKDYALACADIGMTSVVSVDLAEK